MLFLLYSKAFIFLCHAGHYPHKALDINSPQFANKLCSKCVSKLDMYICNDFSTGIALNSLGFNPQECFTGLTWQILSTYNAIPMTIASIY